MSISVLHVDARRDQTAVVADVSGTAAADVDQRGERKALDILFVHFVVDFSYKYNNLPVDIRRKVKIERIDEFSRHGGLFCRSAKGELCIEKL